MYRNEGCRGLGLGFRVYRFRVAALRADALWFRGVREFREKGFWAHSLNGYSVGT